MKVKCPTCEHEFEIVSNEGLIDLGITPNVRARAAEKGLFPKPWVEFPNRHVWLLDDVLSYRKEQTLRKTRSLVDPVLREVMLLPDVEREAALSRLREQLDEASAAPTKAKGRTRKTR